MAQYQITVDQELLQQLFLGHSKDAGVAKLLESVLNQILQAQVTEQVAAERYERTDARQGYRNGSYPHQLTTRVGTITLRVQWGVHTESGPDYRRALWHPFFQVHRFRLVPKT